MHIRLSLKGWQFYAALSHSVKQTGVNSLLPNKKHILMWDFDGQNSVTVVSELKRLQKKWKLSNVYIFSTGLLNYWHAYCFTACDWAIVLHILAETKGLDQSYFKIGVIRGYFTLRYHPKRNRDFGSSVVLPSKVPEDVDPFELSNLEYWTKRI